jgi:hypothetical protein
MENTSIFEKKIDPVYQAAGALAAVAVFILLGAIVTAGSAETGPTRWPWLCAASFLLLFSIFNAIMSATAKNLMKYWGRSIYSFGGLAVGSGLLAWLFSGLTISEAGSYKWIFFVVTFGYLVFLCMIAFMKQIVEFAQKEEWNRPKWRQKKRRK